LPQDQMAAVAQLPVELDVHAAARTAGAKKMAKTTGTINWAWRNILVIHSPINKVCDSRL